MTTPPDGSSSEEPQFDDAVMNGIMDQQARMALFDFGPETRYYEDQILSMLPSHGIDTTYLNTILTRYPRDPDIWDTVTGITKHIRELDLLVRIFGSEMAAENIAQIDELNTAVVSLLHVKSLASFLFGRNYDDTLSPSDERKQAEAAVLSTTASDTVSKLRWLSVVGEVIGGDGLDLTGLEEGGVENLPASTVDFLAIYKAGLEMAVARDEIMKANEQVVKKIVRGYIEEGLLPEHDNVAELTDLLQRALSDPMRSEEAREVCLDEARELVEQMGVYPGRFDELVRHIEDSRKA